MRIFSTIPDLKAELGKIRTQKQVIGFVPTMGALHEGHLSLIDASARTCDVTVCSIFVNPTQFNNSSDLEAYPSNIEADKAALVSRNCDILFLPAVNEMYPEPPTDTYRFASLEGVMEGEKRPGHFNGVAQVVRRLFEAVEPHKAFFGLKDYQQYLIIQELVKQLNSPIEIVACETVREPDGLAMSSRNKRLTTEFRKKATVISRAMKWINEQYSKMPLQAMYIKALEMIKQEGLDPEYITVANAETLEPAQESDTGNLRVFAAAWANDVRLIDNMPIIT